MRKKEVFININIILELYNNDDNQVNNKEVHYNEDNDNKNNFAAAKKENLIDNEKSKRSCSTEKMIEIHTHTDYHKVIFVN